jgi:hypothetical protein
MRFFNDLYSEIAKQELLAIRTEDDALPNGHYAFLEYFCDNLKCRCATVMLDVVSLNDSDPEKSKGIAVIDYSWEEPISENNPSLHQETEQSHLAQDALADFRDFIKHNSFYAERFNKHYEMVRNYIQHEEVLPNENNIFKGGRNDPCPCGSGKKFKKCCL